MYYPCSENKGADQLRGYFVFAYADCWFSHGMAQIQSNNLIKAYTVCNQCLFLSGKRVQNASEEEEERYNDILIVMELLTNLLTKDFVDFGDGENGLCYFKNI